MTQKVIVFHYVLTGKDGGVLDSSKGRGPLAFFEGSGQIIPGLERALSGLKKGDKKKVDVPAAQAYGERKKELLIKVAKDKLPAADVKVGDRFRGGPDGDASVFQVVEIAGVEVTLDANHSLAGQDLSFDVEIADVREATAEEIAHGHPHGVGGAH